MDDYNAEQLTESLLGIVEELTLIRKLMESRTQRHQEEFKEIWGVIKALTPLVDAGVTVGYNNDHNGTISFHPGRAIGDDRDGQGGGTD